MLEPNQAAIVVGDERGVDLYLYGGDEKDPDPPSWANTYLVAVVAAMNNPVLLGLLMANLDREVEKMNEEGQNYVDE